MKIKNEFDEAVKAITEKQRMYIENARKTARVDPKKPSVKAPGDPSMFLSNLNEDIGRGGRIRRQSRRRHSGKNSMRPTFRAKSSRKGRRT